MPSGRHTGHGKARITEDILSTSNPRTRHIAPTVRAAAVNLTHPKNETTKPRTIVTGGAGFIGSALVRHLITNGLAEVLNIDKLTYAGSRSSLTSVENESSYHFLQADILDTHAMTNAIASFEPTAIMHLAAESHVDRSIAEPDSFIQTNVVGTHQLLECTLQYWKTLAPQEQTAFRFHHISTDEVYGSLASEGLFTERTPYDPHNPYSASKASSDHLVRAWHHTYGLPVLITNCSNNYGPYQLPEKLIPLMIIHAMQWKPLPVYGRGEHIRDWIHVEDHVSALWQVISRGIPGETYNIGGNCERSNLEIVNEVCRILDNASPSSHGPHRNLIEFVTDRPGHDMRYAVDTTRIQSDIGWKPARSFEEGLASTIQWYLNNDHWWKPILETLRSN